MKINSNKAVKRYKQIVNILLKYGFGLIMEKIGILKHLNIKKTASNDKMVNIKFSRGERLRLAFEELGPVFIKLGQFLSTREDIFPKDIIEELKKLQDSVKPFSFSDVKLMIETEFNEKIENIYKEFDKNPLAAASISQVHRARLNSGKDVAVKIQRPKIEKDISLDLKILKDISNFINHYTKYGKLYDFKSMALEFENNIKGELDFIKEGENTEIFRNNCKQDKSIKAPEIKWIYTSKRVLTMEYVDGIKIDKFDELDKAGLDKKMLAKKISESICNQIFRDGFFHGDPHPGNLLVLSDGRIVFLDFGIVCRLGEERKRIMADFFVGIALKDKRKIIKSFIDMGTVRSRQNFKKFEIELGEIIDKYMTLSWNDIKISEIFHDIFSIAFLNDIKLPHEFVSISKTFILLQDLLKRLAPDLNGFVIAKPIAKKMIKQSFFAKQISCDIGKSLLDYKEVLVELPLVVLDFLSKMEEDDFIPKFEVKNIDNIQKKFDRNINRISFSIVLLSVSIIIAGIIIGSGLSSKNGAEMYILNIMVLKIGLIIAGIIILGLIISMFRSNGFK
ncbi:ABC1 kinase family protein [Clostridium kluyveri]|uniref:ABC1 atypical kinase-like domain-containing protein n=2 Tax=Clostridium kluyveri TaxID=1534 RepID=A5N2X4_CLOK5|nr:AarF/UbiB family protein [Clostridium kluyveri]EDK35470.1 Predicted protein kinase [Clostridium kluyveri DSM 555]BAH08119.1 hypothetical protein CKR_3068 [Clostridium kluyveri NBRC 12016]